MCVGPEVFAALGAGTKAASTLSTIASVGMTAMKGLQFVSGMQQAKHAEQMGVYNQQVAQNEAIAARQKAAFDEKQHRRQVAQMKGTQRARLAEAGGELLDAGDVLDMTEEQAELDALAIRYGGTVRQQAAQQRGVQARMEAQGAARQQRTKAGTTLLAGAKSGLNYLAS